MNGTLAEVLPQLLEDAAIHARFQSLAAHFLDRYGKEPAAAFAEPVLRGLARLLAAHGAAAGFLARRSALFGRVRALAPGYLERRGRELEREARRDPGPDLETFLDEIRLLRREEMLLAACLDLSGAASFEAVSTFLSQLAESIVQRALRMAQQRTGAAQAPPLAALGMGKIAGREFTYHSDLDLIFLTRAGAEGVEAASKVAQRAVGYLSTMTGAGIAYAVDARLRPSGHQGMLVTSFAGFEHYQLERAETWEHLALLRARAIAGDVAPAQAVLDRVRAQVLQRDAEPWRYVADLRLRVQRERARAGPEWLAFKTGAGGIMDIEFLAAAGVLERGRHLAGPVPPAIPAMLRVAAGRTASEALLPDYAFLRRLEARVRLVSDRAAEELEAQGEPIAVVAALLEPGWSAADLRRALGDVRSRVRAHFERVIARGSIDALAG